MTSEKIKFSVDTILRYNNVNKVFVINLKRREDRLLFLKFKLEKINLNNYEIVEAIDGTDTEITKMYTTYREKHLLYAKNPKFNCKLNQNYPVNSVGAFGLLMTYKKLLDNIPLDNRSNVMILEDDIMFHNNFGLLLDKQIDRLKTADVLYIGANQSRFSVDMGNEMKQGYYNLSSVDYYWTYGAYGIILTPNLINLLRASLTDMLSVFLLPVDLLIWSIAITNNMNGVVLYPNLIIPQLNESDNMGKRDIKRLCVEKKWDLSLYDYVNTTSLFNSYYNNMINTNVSFINPAVSLRSTNIVYSNEMINDDISRVIENKNNTFVFIIPSYNNELYYKKNLDSIFKQNYPFYRIIYTDDASTDNTYNLVKKYIIDEGFQHKTTLIKNDVNMKQAYTRYIMYNMCQDDEICCMLDGDDWLFDENVLTKLNDLYKANNLLISYGQFYYYYNDKIQRLSGLKTYNIDTIMRLYYRKHPDIVVTQHLRTCNAKLLKTIPIDYIKFNGEFLECCSDIAEMLWVLERSEGRHMNAGFPTLVYNKDSSLLHDNSYYNIDKSEYWKKYRVDVERYLRMYPILTDVLSTKTAVVTNAVVTTKNLKL